MLRHYDVLLHKPLKSNAQTTLLGKKRQMKPVFQMKTWKNSKSPFYLTSSMKHIFPCKANSDPDIVMTSPLFNWDRSFIRSVYKSPSVDRILSQMNPVHTVQTVSLRSILIILCYLRLRLPSDLCLTRVLTNTLYSRVISIMSATCYANM
jgi:hypothetical protein